MSYDLILRQALKLHDEGRLDEAERLYRQILETAPDHPVVLNLLGLVAQSKGLHEQAVSFFARAVEQNPQSAEYHFNLAWSEERRGKAAEAIKAYLRALQLQPGIKEARNALGNLYAGLGQTERAVNNIIRPHCSTPLTSNRAPTWQKRKTTFRRCKNCGAVP